MKCQPKYTGKIKINIKEKRLINENNVINRSVVKRLEQKGSSFSKMRESCCQVSKAKEGYCPLTPPIVPFLVITLITISTFMVLLLSYL